MTRLYRFVWVAGLLLSSSGCAWAQLTVFNVPSSEITDKGRVSFQQQFEFTEQIESATTATYGLGKSWEIGLNLLNLNYSTSSHGLESNDLTDSIPYAPLLTFNAQKVFDLPSGFSIGLGVIAGTNLSAHHHWRPVYYNYANLLFEAGSEDQFKFTAGAYTGNHHYLSEGKGFGFQGATELGICPDKVHLLADWISGNHQKGRLSVGISVYITKQIPLSLGWQRMNCDGSQAAVLQLTILPK